MLVHTKAFLYETLVDVTASLLLDLLHRVFDLVSSAPACLTIFAPPLCG